MVLVHATFWPPSHSHAHPCPRCGSRPTRCGRGERRGRRRPREGGARGSALTALTPFARAAFLGFPSAQARGRWRPRRVRSEAGKGLSASPDARLCSATNSPRRPAFSCFARPWSLQSRRDKGGQLRLALNEGRLSVGTRGNNVRRSLAQSVSAFGC